MLPMTERHVFERRVDELVFRTLALCLTNARESEWVKYVRVGIMVLVMVYSVRGGHDEGVLRDERAVHERNILQHFARHGGCGIDKT